MKSNNKKTRMIAKNIMGVSGKSEIVKLLSQGLARATNDEVSLVMEALKKIEEYTAAKEKCKAANSLINNTSDKYFGTMVNLGWDAQDAY